MTARLAGSVQAFVDAVAPMLQDLADRAGLERQRSRADVLREASDIVGALFSADRTITGDEIVAMIDNFGTLDEPRTAAGTPPTRRREMLLEAGTSHLETPSTLFALLRDADLADGGSRSATYRGAALDMAYAAVALDGYTGGIELKAVEDYRGMLDRLVPRPRPGRGRPGRPAPARTDPAPESEQRRETVAVVDESADREASIEEVMAELDRLIGLEPVKAQVRQVADLLRVERMRVDHGLPVAPQSLHLVFTGNPGTGKTTVARLLAQIYRALGALPSGQLVETDRSGLVAGYVGQTATRVREVVDAADGGLLLIDEAYALASGGPTDFGREAVDALVKLMEDRRDTLAVIVAGYPRQMEHFVNSNPGLRSRFPRTIHFPDYNSDELLAIIELLADKHHYRLTDGARRHLRARFDAAPRGPGFGNGRLARNLFEEAVARQAGRLVRREQVDADDLMRITATDVRDPDLVPADPAAEG